MRTRFIFGAVLLSWMLSNLDISGGTIFSPNGITLPPAFAGLFSVSNDQVQSNAPEEEGVFLDLDGTGTVDFEFETPSADVLTVITFNAICSVGSTGNTRVDINIIVDRGTPDEVVVSPTGGAQNILCSGNNTITPNDGKIAGTVIGHLTIGTAGGHTLSIRATALSVVGAPIPLLRIGPLTVVIHTLE
jgi:hypothetical protein